jgi:Tfp pilus assembly protein PilP
MERGGLMMNKLVTLVVFLLLVLAGCSNPIKDDLLNYINVELPEIAQY